MNDSGTPIEKEVVLFKGTDQEEDEEKDEYKLLIENELKWRFRKIPILSFETNESALVDHS